MDDELRELSRRAAQGDAAAREALIVALRRAGKTPFVLPRLNESDYEATIAEWSVAAGDRVRKDQILAMVDLDKISVDLEAPADGIVAELSAAPGATVRVGELLAVLDPLPPLDPVVEARHAALVGAIAAAPADPARRLAYAAFLLETAARGEGVGSWGGATTGRRGELIERLARDPDSERGLRPADLALLTRTARDLAPALGGGRDAHFEAGFLHGVEGPARWLAARWATLVERAPLRALGLSGATVRADVDALLAAPRLEQVSALSVDGQVEPVALAALLASPRLRPRRLRIGPTVEPVEAFAALGARELWLHHPPPAWLARRPVERLDLQVRVDDEAALRALVDAVPPGVPAVAVLAWRAGEPAWPQPALLTLLGGRHRAPGRWWSSRGGDP